MRLGGKKMVVTAIILIVCGLALSAAAFAIMGGVRSFETKSEKKTYAVGEKFAKISIDVDIADVRLVFSDGGECKVECTETDTVYHTVEVKNGTLEIKSLDKRKWYEHFSINLNFGSMEVTVYLPEQEYDELFISTKSGNITVERGTSFANTKISTLSGDVEVSSSIRGELVAKSVSGKVTLTGSSPSALNATSTSGAVTLSSIESQGEVYVKTTSGKISSEGVRAEAVDCVSTSGEVMLSSIEAQGKVYAKTTSGKISSEGVRAEVVDCVSTSGKVLLRDVVAEEITCATVSGAIRITDSDASRLKMKTTSGDVRGTLLTPKLFKTSTVSGDVSVTSEPSDSECEVSTVSGDISITTAGR